MTLRLAAVESGSGPPVAILHGLFGSGRNWAGIARQLAARYRVIALDLRNHGTSPWAETMDYAELAEDVHDTMQELGCRRFALIGHSMGGKAAMVAALRHAVEVERLVVVDIAPVAYAPHHLGYVQAMRRLDLHGLTRRSEADARLAAAVPDVAERAFLMQNLVFDPHPDPPPLAGEGRVGAAQPRWRLNLTAIEHAMPQLVGFPAMPPGARYEGPALFIAGGRSDYLRSAHEPGIRCLFPAARIARIADAGHWLHAERPQVFLDLVEPFLAGE